ncbi:hypothetical protein GW750_05580 [bacterium]|nr:hypothetical protein [bacterium]
MQTEFEIKFYPVNKDALRQQLTKLGAVCTHPRRLMRRKAYPVANHGVDSKYFRVRDE